MAATATIAPHGSSLFPPSLPCALDTNEQPLHICSGLPLAGESTSSAPVDLMVFSAEGGRGRGFLFHKISWGENTISMISGPCSRPLISCECRKATSGCRSANTLSLSPPLPSSPLKRRISIQFHIFILLLRYFHIIL